MTCSDALMDVVTDILDVSKIEAGKLVLEQHGFDLCSALDHALSVVAVKAKEKHLKLTLELGHGLPDILIGDVTRFRQIVVNLLSNAIKFTESGSIHLRAEAHLRPDGRCEVTTTVADTGIVTDQQK